MNTIEQLPPRVDSSALVDQERQYRTALSSADYLQLETEALQRGMKPYGLTKSIITLYLHGKLVFVQDLPKDLQQQVTAYLQNKLRPLKQASCLFRCRSRNRKPIQSVRASDVLSSIF